MIRVLQIGMTDNLGGIETFLMNYYKNMNRSEVQFDFINIYENGLFFKDEIMKMGGKIYNISSYYKHPFKYIKELKKIINDNNYNIIHCNMNSAAMIYPLIASKLSNAKVIISHSHNSSSDKGFLKTIIHNINKHFIPLLATNYFACSEVAGEWFFSRKVRSSDKYKIIYNGIDFKKFNFNEESRIKKRKELGISSDTLVLGHVGRFNKQKNHRFLVEVFAEINKINCDSKLLLVGTGPLNDEILDLVKKLGIEDNVLFLGQRSDTNELYCAMDLFLLPSLYEGLPLVGVEAQVSGLKCLFSSNITRELSLSNYCEYLPLDKNMWVDKIKNIKVMRNNLSLDDSKFSIDRCTEELKEIYMKENKTWKS